MTSKNIKIGDLITYTLENGGVSQRYCIVTRIDTMNNCWGYWADSIKEAKYYSCPTVSQQNRTLE